MALEISGAQNNEQSRKISHAPLLLTAAVLTLGDVQKATEYKYMRILRFNLSTVNGWPGEEIGEGQAKYRNLQSCVQISGILFCMSTGIIFMVKNSDKSFYELGHMMITVMMGFVEVTRIIQTLPQAKKYRNLATVFLTKMHLLFFKDMSEYAMTIHRKVHLMSHLLTLCLTGQMICGLALFNIIPMWSNYAAGNYKHRVLYNTTYEHSLYLSIPVLKIYTHFDAYLVAFIYNWVMSYLCSISICMLDLLLALMIVNLWGHLKILLHNLETFPLPARKVVLSMDDRNASVSVDMYSEDELEQISQKLKQCIEYHRLIKDFTDQMSEVFGPMLFIYYAFHQVSGCLLLLECSQMTAEALIRYVPLSLIIFQQLIQLSVIFELLGSTSEKLKDAVYGLPWQYMDTKNRQIVSMFLYHVQEPIHVKALGVVDVGVTTMATILKTSLSYFTFLRSM